MLNQKDKLVFLFLHSKKDLSFRDLVTFLKENNLPLSPKWYFYWHGLNKTFSEHYFEKTFKPRITEWFIKFWEEFYKDKNYRLQRLKEYHAEIKREPSFYYNKFIREGWQYVEMRVDHEQKIEDDFKRFKYETKLQEKEWNIKKAPNEENCEVCDVYPCMCNDVIE